MMSLRVAFSGIGAALGIAICGVALELFNYQSFALVLGAMDIVGSVILFTATKEPVQNLANLTTE